jgi:O-antigen/teichoic acid export membrane protein
MHNFLFKTERILRPFFYGILLFVAANFLEKDDYSTLNLTFFLYTLISMVSTLGIEGVVKRDFRRKDGNFTKYSLEQIFITRIFVSLAFILFGYIYLTLVNANPNIIFIALPIFLFQSFEIYEWVLVARNKYKDIVKVRLISTLICCLIKILSIIKANYFLFIFSHFIEYLILTIAYLINGHIIFKPKNLKIYFNNEIIWYFFSTLVIVILLRVDQLAVGAFLKLENLAVYSMAIYIVQTPVALISHIFIKDYNLLLRIPNDSEKLKIYYKSYIKKIFYTSFFLWALIFIGSYFVKFIFIDKYQELGLLVRVLSFSIILNSISLTHAPYWLKNRLSNIVFKLTLLNLLLFLAVYLIFGRYLQIYEFAAILVVLLIIVNLFTPLIFKSGRCMSRIIYCSILNREIV